MMNESVIDPTRTGLDPAIFDDDVLNRDVREQLLDVVKRFDFPIRGIFIKGSMLSKQWLENTDLDVLLITDDMPDDGYERIKEMMKDNDEKIFAIGTKHPLQFYVIRGEYDVGRADGIYDVVNDEWVRGPYDLEIDVENYWDEFEKAVSEIDVTQGELQRDIIDYGILRRFRDEDVTSLQSKLNYKLQEIDDGVEELIAVYDELSDMRDAAFEQELSPQELKDYGSKNALPANVIFKLLERYHYVDFMKRLKKLRKTHGKIDDDDDVRRIVDL